MFHSYISTHWKSNVSRDETLAFYVSFLVSMFHFLFTTPLSKKLSGRKIKPQWERFKTSMGEKSNPNGRNITETLESKMKHRMPMFHLLKVLIINTLCYENETWNKKRLKVNIMYAYVRARKGRVLTWGRRVPEAAEKSPDVGRRYRCKYLRISLKISNFTSNSNTLWYSSN